MSGQINIGLVGLGKIAYDQHLPALLASPEFNLIAVTRGSFPPPPHVRVFETMNELLQQAPDLQAVTLCTPPQGRSTLAQSALDRGLHVMLETPPGQTITEVESLIASATEHGLALFGSWYSREAPGVEIVRQWVAQSTLREVQIVWREDVRRWQPKQAWIWDTGGMGVFDAGINFLSIVSRILPNAITLENAQLSIPANRSVPIAADLDMADARSIRVRANFDWRHSGLPSLAIDCKVA